MNKESKKQTEKTFTLIERLSIEKKTGKKWNIIKRTKHKPTSYGGISLKSLEEYFCAKFKDAASENKTDDMSDARINVYNKFCDVSKPGLIMDEIFNEFQVRKYIKCLKSETAPGIDGIQLQHLKYSLNSNLPSLLSNLFTVCLRFGIIPDSFCKGYWCLS